MGSDRFSINPLVIMVQTNIYIYKKATTINEINKKNKNKLKSSIIIF